MAGFFRNLNIKSKLLGGYALIFITAILVGGISVYYTVQTTVEANIESELTHATAAIQTMVQTAASTSIKNHLRAVAEKNTEIVHGIYTDYLSGQISEHQAKLMARKILFSQTIGKTGYIFCADSNGIAIEHPNIGVAGKRFMDHEFVQAMIRQKHGYLEYDWKNPEDHYKKPKAMYMAYFEPWDWIIAASSYREEFRELIDISDFRDSVLGLRFGKTGYAYITDSKGNLIVHPFLSGNYDDVRGENDFSLVQTFSDLKNGKLIYSWKNPGEPEEREKLVIFNYIPEYDWVIASTSYLEEIYAPLKMIRQVFLVTFLVILVLVFLTTLWVNTSVIAPLKSLMNSLATGASGDFAIRMKVASTDEIGQLAGYFNNFMEKLEKYSASLNQEIDHHRKTEQALRISEEKYRLILERMEEGYFEITDTGQFVFFNASMEKLLGTPDSRLLHARIHEFMNSQNAVKLNTLLRSVQASGQAVQISDLELTRPDGSVCYIETSISRLINQDRNLTGFSGVLRDVSQRRKREQALKLSEELFSKAFRCSPGGMLIVSIKDTRIINVNDRFLSITGYSLFELIGKELTGLHFFDKPSDGRKLFKIISRKKKITPMEFRFISSSGEKRMGILSAEIVDVWGEKCLLAAVEDITESRTLEQEILNISEKERQKIAMALHDDLCPQLIGIEVMTKVLAGKLSANASEDAAGADQIRKLILNSIEKTRRLSQGLFPVDLSDHGFEAALKALGIYIQDVFGIGCTLSCHASWTLQDTVVATQVYYIVHEAVHNAAKHASAGQIQMVLAGQDDKLVVTVTDDGCGLPGTAVCSGMGMKIMRYRAARIGASVEVGTGIGGGTRVLLELEK